MQNTTEVPNREAIPACRDSREKWLALIAFVLVSASAVALLFPK
jgi:hypothetical protein